MDIVVVVVVLGAAVLHASWNALVKSGGNPWIGLAITNAATGLSALPLVLLQPLPDARAWPFLLASVAVHLGYNILLAASYQLGDYSRVYPIARGVAPLLVAVSAAAFAGESLSFGGWCAVALLGIGFAGLGHRGQSWRALWCALGAGVCIAGYTVLDGLGFRAGGVGLGYIGWLFVLDALPFGVLVLARNGRAVGHTIADSWPRFVTGGLCAALAYGAVIWATGRASLASVSAMRETSVVAAAVIGAVVLKEPLGARRFAASIVVALGTALLVLQQS